MTAIFEAPPWRERGDIQWAHYGVNVGHAIYGDIHLHPPASAAGRSRRRDEAHPVPVTWHAAARSALIGLARACDRAAAALAYLRPDEAGKEEE